MIEDLKSSFPSDIDGISLNHSGGYAQARDGELYANISITGVNADFTKANNISMLSGKFISDTDVKETNQSAVVSDKLVKNMFPEGLDPIGKQVKVYKTSNIELFTIIGVYRFEQMSFGGSTVSDKDISSTFYIPVSTAKQNLVEKNYTNLTVVGTQNADMTVLTNRVQNYFDGVYSGNAIWRASAFNMTSMLDTIADTMSTISVSIAIIAGISLLVGGIGVMNIMLVSVTERTREIGTRKALGAKNYHIQFQFVTEAIIISSIGGTIGLLLGISAGAVITSIFDVALVISPLTTAGCVLFSMMIGIFFGLYPANKAAKLDPIVALRYE
jgi:putative ABC transport system permease protein